MDPACRRRIRPRGRSDLESPAAGGGGRHPMIGAFVGGQTIHEAGVHPRPRWIRPAGAESGRAGDQRRRRRTAAPIAQSPLAIRAQVEGSGTGVKLSIRLLPNSETENMPPPSAFWKRLPESTKK